MIVITHSEATASGLVRVHATDSTGRRAVMVLDKKDTTDDKLEAIFRHKFSGMGENEGKP